MSAMTSEITNLTLVHSTVYSRRRSKQTSKLRVSGLCAGNSPVTGEFSAKKASNAKMFLFDDVIMGSVLVSYMRLQGHVVITTLHCNYMCPETHTRDLQLWLNRRQFHLFGAETILKYAVSSKLSIPNVKLTKLVSDRQQRMCGLDHLFFNNDLNSGLKPGANRCMLQYTINILIWLLNS